MTPENFVYWLQGYFELSDGDCSLSKEKVDIVRRHLALVLTNVTNEEPSSKTEEHQNSQGCTSQFTPTTFPVDAGRLTRLC